MQDPGKWTQQREKHRGIHTSLFYPSGPPPRRYCLGSDAAPPTAGVDDAEGFLPSPQQLGRAGSAGQLKPQFRSGRRASEACIASPSGGGGGSGDGGNGSGPVEAGWALASLRRMHSARFLVTVDPVDETKGGEGGCPNTCCPTSDGEAEEEGLGGGQ